MPARAGRSRDTAIVSAVTQIIMTAVLVATAALPAPDRFLGTAATMTAVLMVVTVILGLYSGVVGLFT